MTCGIYKLLFTGTYKVYIGQSVNIEKRFKEHCNNLKSNHSNNKLHDAYLLYGLPYLEVLSECTIEELDTQEDECIDIYNSVNNGFNIHYTSNQAPSYTGYGYGNSKYSKDSIINVFMLLVNTNKAYTTIESMTGIPSATICNISLGKSHVWLKEEYPIEYDALINTSISRDSYTIVSNKLSAEAKGIIYPKIKSPEGTIYTITNAYKFAKSNGLAPNHFQEVLNKHRKSHKGWKLV